MSSGGSGYLGRQARFAVAVVLALCSFLAYSASAAAYSFNEPSVKQTGPEEVVFDWETGGFDDQGQPIGDACDAEDIPDAAARAYRVAPTNDIVLFSSHLTTRRFIGASFDNLQHPCNVVMSSGQSMDPAAFNDREWLSSPYTVNGTSVYALVHEEYQGWRTGYGHSCVGTWTEQQKCWRNTITFATSANGGASFSSPGTPVASSPVQFESGIGPYGYFKPSNIVRHTDGYYYALVRSIGNINPPPQHDGICLMRTSNIAIPTSWRAWDGTGFNVRFINPYTEPGTPDPADHVCRAVDSDLVTMSSTLVYSTHLNQYLALDTLGGSRPGIWYSTSPDLLNWSPMKLLMDAEVAESHDCGDADPVRVPSLIDHSSTSRNFETIGKTAHLYFTRANMIYNDPSDCYLDLDRDMVRIPIEFDPASAPPPAGGGTPGPGGPVIDTSAAKLVLRASKKQDVDKLTLTITVNESATVEATGSVNVPGASRVHKFKRVRRSAAANKRVRLKLKLSKKSLKTVKSALRKRKKLTARVKITATDGGANKTVKRVSIRLKP